MEIKDLKIGYVPYSADLQHPDDRRRFPFYAQRRGLKYEIAVFDRQYDIIILPAPANLSGWLRYKRSHPHTKFIFEMVDSLNYQTDPVNILFKGMGRYLTGKESAPVIYHKNLLLKWLGFADVVLSSSPKLREEIQNWNKNVLLSLDYLDHEYQFLKKDYEINGKMKLVWEGQGVVVPFFLSIKEVLREVSDFCELHVVTSKTFPRFGPYFQKDVATFLKKLPIKTYLHIWDLEGNLPLFPQMDCAIIPLDKKDRYGWHKPANKLLSFWFSGLPVLCSNTPAYTQIAHESGSNILCASQKEWVQKLKSLRKMKADDRRKLAETNYDFVIENYGSAVLDKVWENAFEILLG